MSKKQIALKTIEANNHIYVRSDSIVEYLLEMAATEETNVAFRINQAALIFSKMKLKGSCSTRGSVKPSP